MVTIAKDYSQSDGEKGGAGWEGGALRVHGPHGAGCEKQTFFL